LDPHPLAPWGAIFGFLGFFWKILEGVQLEF
jgi:hypothetical protein